MTVLGVIGVASSMAQQQQKTTGADLPSEKSLSPTMTAKDALLEKAKVNPMEGPVDPAAYIVGPSDQLYLVLSGPLSFMQLVQVTPEGTLIIPTVGEIRVAGETLGRTKEIVSQEVRKKYKLGQVTLTLVSLREFVVTLRGAVLREGKYVVSAVDRVEKVLTLGASVESPRPSVTIPLGSPRWGDPLGDRQEEIPKYRLPSTIDNRASLRNIRVIRKNRDTIRVDLLKYNVTGDDRYNPVLLDGDLITVPQRNLSQNFITIDGAVNAPGRYEYVEGDDLMTILTIAQGLTMTADSSRVVIARQNEKGELYQELTVDVNSTLGKKTTSPLVHRGDRITVRFRSYEQKNYQVILSGQIHAPGIYPISRKSTKLSKIVRDAGGLNNDALLKGSVLLRKEDRMEGLVDPRFDMTQLARANNFRSADSTYYYTEFEIGRYPVVVDFVKLFVEHDSTQDIVLRDGDILYIASNEQTVLVQGQVARSGYVAFVPGARSEYYVRSTGGFSDLAEIGEIKIIKRGSFDWVDPDKTTIDPGDRIWVPKKPRREFEYYFRIVSDVASILAAVATTVLLTIRITQ
jgi:protein involved in polysaccharide export with SLBB domain